MELFAGICLFIASLPLVLIFGERIRSSHSGISSRRMPGHLAPTGLALLAGSLLGGCGSSPPILTLTISPSNGTVFVGASAGQAARQSKSSRKLVAAPLTARPEDFSSATCNNLQYSATATYSDGKVVDVSSLVNWTSSNSAAATIDNTGHASAVALGNTYIDATLKGADSGRVPLWVDQLNSMAISPATATLPIGSATTPSTLQFAAAGAFTQANGTANQGDITSQVIWSSTNPNVATISANGIVSSVTQGTTNIVATVCGISNTAMLTVGPPGPVSLQITPATPTIVVGSALPFSALELYSDGTTYPVTSTLQWSSSSGNSIISSLTGVAFGVSPGMSTITATESGGSLLTGTAPLRVQAAQAKFAYVANLQGKGSGGSISSFTVNAAAGTLPSMASTAATAPQQVLLGPSGSFLYSIDSSSFVHVYQITSPSAATSTTPAGTLTLLDNATPSPYPPVIAGGGGKNFGVIDPTGQFLYVIDRTANTLYGFQIQQSQSGATPFGSLQAISNGAPFSGSGFTFSQPTWVTTDRSGQFLYVINAGNNAINGYFINFDGTLTPLTSLSPLPQTGNGPVYGTTDNQKHLYIVNGADTSVTAYLINSDGTWASIGTLPVTGATAIVNVLTDPAGKYVYVLDQGGTSGGQVFAYNLILPTAGTVFGTQIGQQQPVGSSPTGIAVDPSGALLVVDNKGSNDISLFTIAKGGGPPDPGTLTPATPGTVPTDQSPQFVVFYNVSNP